MSDADDTERDMRLELLRLDRELKLLDLKRGEQQLVYAPVKFVLLALTFAGVLAAFLLLLR